MHASPIAIGSLGLFVLLAAILLRVPVGIAMIATGLSGYALLAGTAPALTLLTGDPVSYLSSVDFVTVPLFLLMGSLASAAGFSSDVYKIAGVFLGHRRGGLSYATLLGSAAFGAICGSSTATAATFGRIAVPEMLDRGYDPRLATGTVAAGGALKSLIPPSLVMILYCIVTKTYIISLFHAALIPGAITLVFNFVAIAVMVRVNPRLAPVGVRVAWAERFRALRSGLPAMLLLVIVFGGLYSGIFTISEAASAGVVVTLVFALLRRRLTWKTLSAGMLECAGVSVMLYVIVFGASVFTYFMNVAHVPETLVGAINDLHAPRLLTIGMLLLVYLVLGSVFDEISAIVVTVPFVLPIVVALGYDPLWWGIMMVVQVEIALIHPPLGIIAFLLHAMFPGIPMRSIYRGVLPFLLADFAVLVLLVAFPGLVLWLPSLFD